MQSVLAAAAVVAGVLALMLNLAVSPAVAAPTSVTIAGGSLAVTAPTVQDFAVVVLDGTAKMAHTSLQPFAVTDARGSGQGWTLSLQATPFREWDGSAYVPAGKMLPAGSLTLGGLSATAVDTTSDAPTIIAGPYLLDGPAVTVAAASAGAGMGTFVFDQAGMLAVAVPAHAYARAYRSELSISVASGP